MKMALEASFQKNQEAANQVSQLKQEIEKIKAEQKKSEEEMIETAVQELKDYEAKLEQKTNEADQH